MRINSASKVDLSLNVYFLLIMPFINTVMYPMALQSASFLPAGIPHWLNQIKYP